MAAKRLVIEDVSTPDAATAHGYITAGDARMMAGPAVTDFVCGLRKLGHAQYALVTGRIVDGVAELKVDSVSQPLEHAADELRDAFQKMMAAIP